MDLHSQLKSFLFAWAFFWAVLTVSASASAQISFTRETRIQSFLQNTKNPKDIYDTAIRSPKSAHFSFDGRKLYINSLEGYQTVVYSWPDLKKVKTINHVFNENNQHLFKNGESTIFDYPFFQKDIKKNNFKGKPVEMTLSHEGRYLWVPYYRRNYDESAQSPSAVAIVDTTNDEIVRVMPTGPIPKYVSVSPDGRTLAVTHWGDNTIGLIDISSSNPQDFTYTKHLVVEKQMSQAGLEGTDRDDTCGFCLRGTVFSPDSRFLIVARMGGGGIATFDLQNNKYLGTVLNLKPTPRHLIVSEDGQSLIVSSNQSGYVTRMNLETLIRETQSAQGQRIQGSKGIEVFVGKGARTIEVDTRKNIVYAAVNDGLKLVAVDLNQMKVIAETGIDPYPVGLALSRDGRHVVITSQGHDGRGGNAVNIVTINADSP